MGLLSITKKFQPKPIILQNFQILYELTASMQWRDTFLDCTHQHVCDCQADHDTTAKFGSTTPETIKLSVSMEPLDGSNQLVMLRLHPISADAAYGKQRN